MSIALLLVDIQNDYFPGGRMELFGSPEAAIQAEKLLSFFRRKAMPIIHVQHIATRPGSTFFLPNTAGAEIYSLVQPHSGETVFQKHFPNSFRETPLLEHVRSNGISRLVIAGMMTHMCVDTTTRAAADLGFSCQLVHDACATRALLFNGVEVPAESVQAACLAALDGSFAEVVSTSALLANL